MNVTAGWIGIYDDKLCRSSIELGEKTGLYKEEKVSKRFTANYLPELIRIEIQRINKQKAESKIINILIQLLF